MRILAFLVLLVLLHAPLVAQCPQLIWQDEFDGDALDTADWNYQIGDGCNIGVCGWGNNELQYYQLENTSVGNGTLKITAKREQVGNKVYTSSRINTKGKNEWTYGRFEANIKLPFGQGIWPAFWMLSSSEPYGPWPESGELDIMEMIGSEPSTTHGTIHFGRSPNNRSSGDSYTLNDGIWNDEFHTFAVEWESNVIRWYVDDYLFSTKASVVTGGSRWPFDHDFHFLLNLAVGGNWPGSPNATTEFPQVMEVDYVRVYDGFFPSLSGNVKVDNQAAGEKYQVNNLPADAEISWQVPGDAVIIGGQNTEEIVIDWKDLGGELLAIYSNECGTDTLSINIIVDPPFVVEESLENFDDPAQIEFLSSSGTLTEDASNPMTNEINGSNLCGKYDRLSSELFDILVYDVSVLNDVEPYLNGEKLFYLDIYTDAPIGTLIILQLENSSRSQPTNYPTGRNSRFQANTTKQNGWERLKFEFLDQPDQFTAPTTIDNIIFLFGSNTNLSNTFYFDNFDSYAPQQTVPVNDHDGRGVIRIYPNPSTDFLRLENDAQEHLAEVVLYNLYGQLEKHVRFDQINQRTSIDISDLASGIYFVRIEEKDGDYQVIRFIKS